MTSKFLLSIALAVLFSLLPTCLYSSDFIGPIQTLKLGDEIVYDIGYWTQAQNHGGHWVSIPAKLILVGITDSELTSAFRSKGEPYLVFRRKEARELNGECTFIEMFTYRTSSDLPKIGIEEISASIRR